MSHIMRANGITRFRMLLMYIGILGVALSGLWATPAAAGVAGCRADPIVKLSDGTILDITAEIDTDVSNVTSISYVVHGPRTVNLLSVLSTPTVGFTGKESFTYYADAPANTYITETVVQTSVNKVSVTAHNTFVSLVLGRLVPLKVQYTPVTGFNGQVLRVALNR